MALQPTLIYYKNNRGDEVQLDAVLLPDGSVQPIHQVADASGNSVSPAADGVDATGITPPAGGSGIRGFLSGIYRAITSALAIATFAPIRGASVALSVGTTATAAPVALASNIATTYRVRNSAASGSAVTWTLSTSNTTVPTIPAPYSAAGTGGTAGDKTIDPGGVEVIGLTAAQQAALAAGTLYLSAICPSGSATLTVTPGNGS